MSFRRFAPLSALLLSSAAWAESAKPLVDNHKIDLQMDSFVMRWDAHIRADNDLLDSLSKVSSGNVDPDKRRVVEEHYMYLRKYYIAEPMRNGKDAILSALANYQKAIESDECAGLSERNANSLQNDINVLRTMIRSSYQPLDPVKFVPARFAEQGMNRAWKEGDFKESLNKLLTSDAAKKCPKAIAAFDRADLALPSSPTPSDPIAAGYDPQLVAMLLESRQLQSTLNDLNKKQNVSAADDAWTQAVGACNTAKQKAQNRTKEMLPTFAEAGVKFLKCVGAPMYGYMYGRLGTQRMTSALAGAPVQAGDYNLDCDPGTQQMYDFMRDQDIARNDAVLERLDSAEYNRRLMMEFTPVQTRFAQVVGPQGEIITPFGIIGAQPYTANNVGVGTGSGRPTGGASSRTPARSLLASTALTNGVARGASGARQVRSLAADVSRGRNPQRAVAQMRGVATQASKYLSSVESSNRRSLAGGATLQNNAQQSNRVRSLTNGVVDASAARQSTDGILDSLRRNPAPAVGQGPTGSQIAQADAERQRAQAIKTKIQAMAKMTLANIEYAIQQSKDLIPKVDELLAKRAARIETARGKVRDLAMGDASREIAKAQREVLDIDRELHTLAAQRRVYETAVRQQEFTLETYARMGATGQLPRVAGGNILGGKDTGLPANYPNFGGTGTGSGGGGGGGRTPAPSASLEMPIEMPQWLKRFALFAHPLPEAHAANEESWGPFKTAKEWLRAYDQFVYDYALYNDSLAADEKKARKAAGVAFNQRSQQVLKGEELGFQFEGAGALETILDELKAETAYLVSSQENGRELASLPASVLSGLRSAKEEAANARSLLDQVYMQYRDQYPSSPETNLDAQWGLLSGLLIQ